MSIFQGKNIEIFLNNKKKTWLKLVEKHAGSELKINLMKFLETITLFELVIFKESMSTSQGFEKAN